MKQLIEYETIAGNDLVASFKCECPDESFKDSSFAHLMKHRIRLYGYNDLYFFEEVNKEPRMYNCKCGFQYKYRWTYEGVEVERIEYNIEKVN